MRIRFKEVFYSLITSLSMGFNASLYADSGSRFGPVEDKVDCIEINHVIEPSSGKCYFIR